MDYFILGIWFAILIVASIVLYKVNLIINHIRNLNKSIDDRYKHICNFIDNDNNIIIKNDNHNSNSIIDRIEELTGCINLSAGNICKLLNMVDAKEHNYIRNTDTMKSNQSNQSNKAKLGKQNKKGTINHKK